MPWKSLHWIIDIKEDVVIIGAGASGMMCALTAGKRGKKVLVLDHAAKPGQKIRMSGGGKCNFTNTLILAEHYISSNVHFCKSALKQFTQWDFIQLMETHTIPYEERDQGQLFCRNSAMDIVDMLLMECEQAGVRFLCNTQVLDIQTGDRQARFSIHTNKNTFHCSTLVIATGGLSIPSAGASPFGYKIAEKFHIPVLPVRAGLVPFTLTSEDKLRFSHLAGIAVNASVSIGKRQFRNNILFTHRGLSGPAILQASLYWSPGELISINLMPEANLFDQFTEAKKNGCKKSLRLLLAETLPKRLVEAVIGEKTINTSLQETSAKTLKSVCDAFQKLNLIPGGTEGYRTAEVTLGGIDTREISSKTMESRIVKGLFFIGEVLDVTGWLGGYNLQWAWSSGFCAGKTV